MHEQQSAVAPELLLLPLVLPCFKCYRCSTDVLNAFRTISNKKRKHTHLQLHYWYSERYDKRVDLKIPFWRSAIFAEKTWKNVVRSWPCPSFPNGAAREKILSTFQAKELLPGPIYKFKIDASWKHHSGINPPRTDIDFQSSKAQMSSQSCSKHTAAYVTVIWTLASFNPVPHKPL